MVPFPNVPDWSTKIEKRISILQQLVVTLFLLSPVLFSLGKIASNSHRPADEVALRSPVIANPSPLEWQEFSINAYQKALETDRIVLVDFYAEWENISNYHQSVTFKDPHVIQEIQNNNVITMRGDWTHEDPEIAAFLESHGLFSIPLLVLTSKSTMQKPLLFPGPLSEEGLLKGIDSFK